MSKRVLLVDDEVELCELLADRLQDEGYFVDQAHSLPEALESFESHGQEIIISDKSMPGGSGVELFEALKKKPTFSQSRFLLISGYVTEDEDLVSQGVHAVIRKPFEFEDLLKVLQ